ncbi:hypothetical protein C0Q70_00366 [Pomacea canaliculata]|uniref:Uncharacterized protein n=1 Tax=Pomacea canaliculata TaxID=400727 RepID=A0A2T7PWF0_POMCA|nr:hypothetical protein C0Q70_00366 [Pomacea canaliculata]
MITGFASARIHFRRRTCPATANCQSLCSGDSGTKCGGIGYVSVYSASQPITGLSLTSDKQDVIGTGDLVTFSVSITSGYDVYYQMDYDDGAGFSQKNATGFDTQTFHVPGVYSVMVDANDFNDTLLTANAVTTVTVHAPVADVDVECDAIFATDEEGVCYVTVWQGTDLNLTVQVQPSLMRPSALQVRAARSMGEDNVDDKKNDNNKEMIMISVIKHYVFFGDSVQIISPSCGGSYCLRTNKCGASCVGSSVSCTTTAFCPRRRLCDDGVCTSANRFNVTGPLIPSYVVKQIVNVVATSVGYQYIGESTLVSVAPGDILGVDVTNSAPAKLYWFDVSADLTNFKVSGTYSTGSTITSGSSSTGPGDNIALRAVVSEGSKVYLPRVFSTEDTYILTVTATNKRLAGIPSAVNSTTIYVLQGVNFTIIDAPDFAKTNTPVILTIEPHTGAQAFYNWSISDGFVLDSCSNRSITHVFTTPGVYNITAATFNSVSFKTNSTTIIIEDELLGLNLTSPTAVSGETHSLSMTLTGGSNYTCLWNFGDGTATNTSDPVSTPVGTTSYLHTFPAPNVYIVNVTCTNLVSALSVSLVQRVQERITGLRLTREGQDTMLEVIVPWTLATGSHVTWVCLLDGVAMGVDSAASNVPLKLWQSVSMGKKPGGAKIVNITASNEVSNLTLSTTYLLVTKIVGPRATASTNKTTTGNDIIYTVGVSTGSDVVVIVNYNDGSVDNKTYSGDQGFSDTFKHNFFNGGLYVVNKLCCAQAPRVPPNRSAPSLPKLILDFGDGEGPSESPLVLGKNYTRRFDDTNRYTVFATVYNDLDGKNFTKDVVIVEKLVDPVIVPDFPKAPVNKALNVTFFLFRGPSAPLANLTWDFGDGLGSQVFGRTGMELGFWSGMNGSDVRSVTYTSIGTKTITVTATTPLETVSRSLTLEVIYPVLQTDITITANPLASDFNSPTTFTVTWNGAAGQEPKNVSIYVTYGDGQVETITFNIAGPGSQISLSHTFVTDGAFATNITVVNPASAVSFISSVGSFKNFLNPTVSMCYKPDIPVNELCRNGVNNAGQQYPLDKDITFLVYTSNNATALWYEITATQGVTTHVCNRTTNPFILTELNQTGNWSITVKAVNPLYQATIPTKMTIVQFVEGFNITHDPNQVGSGLCSCFVPNGRLGTFIEHTYIQEKTFTVKAEARNPVSSVTSEVSFEITGMNCSQPQNLRGIPVITCTVTYDNVKEWRIETINPNNGTSSGLVSLPGVRLDTADLTIGRWQLEWDTLYKATFIMSMNSTDPRLKFMASDYSYFKIIRSDLVGLVVYGGASEIVRGSASGNLELRPLKYSYDPDVQNNDPALSNLVIESWICRERGKPTIILAECTQLEDAAMKDPKRELASFPMASLTVNKTYNVTVFLTKDTRRVAASVEITVTPGDPPQIIIFCAAGSVCYQQTNGYLVLESERLSLDVECANCANDSLTYSWNISVSDYRWPNSWRPLQLKDMGNTVGFQSKQFAILPSLYQAYRPAIVFKAECFVSRGGQTGWASTVLTLNTPPSGGRCSVWPKNATVSTEKIFTINCTGWRDKETRVDLYTFFTTYDPTMVRVQITSMQPTESDGSVVAQVTLAQGLSQRNYSNTVNVCVRDTMGAQNCTEIETIQVYPVPVAEARALVSLLLTTNTNPLTKVIQEGDSISASLFINTIATVINSDSKRSRTVTFHIMVIALSDTFTEFQSQGISSMQTASGLSSYDADRTKAFQQATNDSVEAKAEMEALRDNRAQGTVLSGLNDMASQVDIGPEVPREEKMQILSYMLSVASSVSDGVGLSGLFPTNTARNNARKSEEFKDYDSENTAPSDDCFSCCISRGRHVVPVLSVQYPRTLEEADVYWSSVTSCQAQKKKAQEMERQVNEIRNKVILSFSNNSIPGESQTFASDRSITTLNKTEAGKLFGETQRVGNSTANVKFPSLGNLFPNNSVGENDTFVCAPQAGLLERVSIPQDQHHQKFLVPALGDLHQQDRPPDGGRRQPRGSAGHQEPDLLRRIPFPTIDRPFCTRGMLDNLQVNNFKGTAYLGVRQLKESEHDLNVTDCRALPRWEAGANETEFTTTYSLKIYTSSCLAKNEASNTSDWSAYGLRVSPETDENKTVCLATHMTTFAGGWVVVPNTIDWNFVFSNMDFYKNPTLYITEIVIALVYILAVVWARRKDKKDLEKLGIAPLMDNDAADNYYYEIVTVTGMRKNAGTDSKVFFILSGEEDETDVRQFSDSKRKIFRRGDTNGFLMAVPRPLGYLNYARVWHDNSGKGNFGSWYLNYMIVRDVQTDQKWVFIADKWFAVEEDDGQVDRIIPAATHEQMTQFGHVFAERTRRDLADGHLWFSVLARPPQSRFTCVQRVSCCLCLLYATMLANAMFYRTSSKSSETSSGFSVGPFTLTPEQVFIGVVSNLIVFPVNFLVVYLFRKARPRRKRPSRVDEAIKHAYDNRQEASIVDVKPEVGSIFTMSRGATMIDEPRRPDSAASRPGTSMSARADPSLPTKKKSKSLPWWCRILAWVVLWVATIVSAAFVTFYGISFSEDACRKWITSLLISFFMSVLVTQPIKVFLMAIFMSLIIKNPGDDEDEEEIDEETTKLASDEIPLHPMNSESYGAARPRKIGYKPPDRRELEAARDRRMKEIQMWSVVREVIIYSFFLWILMLISYRTSNSNTFLYKDTMERIFITNVDTDVDFSSIKNADDFWNWTQSGLVNGIRAGPYYNNYPPLLLRGYVNDKVSKILGYAVMRQLRVRPSTYPDDVIAMSSPSSSSSFSSSSVSSLSCF